MLCKLITLPGEAKRREAERGGTAYLTCRLRPLGALFQHGQRRLGPPSAVEVKSSNGDVCGPAKMKFTATPGTPSSLGLNGG